jgi:DNA-binding GntR family transcriptional regulator
MPEMDSAMSAHAPERARRNFFPTYRPRGQRDVPKYLILRDALIAAIGDGYWKSGDRFPTELELTRMTPYSLGTVQRAIQLLVAEGFVTRKHRSGSFVAPGYKRIGGPWLFRFLAEDAKTFLPIFTKVTGRRRVAERGPWFEWLAQGESRKPLLCIDRQIRVEKRLVAFNQVYLDPELYPFIASAPLRELDGANIAHLVQESGRLPVSKMAHTAACAPLPEAACRLLGLSPRSAGLVVEIAASAGNTRPVSYQKLFMAASGPRIYISDSAGDWHGCPVADAPVAPG